MTANEDPGFDRCDNCNCYRADHDDPEIGGDCTSCGDCDGWEEP